MIGRLLHEKKHTEVFVEPDGKPALVALRLQKILSRFILSVSEYSQSWLWKVQSSSYGHLQKQEKSKIWYLAQISEILNNSQLATCILLMVAVRRMIPHFFGYYAIAKHSVSLANKHLSLWKWRLKFDLYVQIEVITNHPFMLLH